MTEYRAEVVFHIKSDLDEDALQAKARELDAAAGNDVDVPEVYTLQQIVQILWHYEPEYLHENVLVGWTLERMEDAEGVMRSVWLK